MQALPGTISVLDPVFSECPCFRIFRSLRASVDNLLRTPMLDEDPLTWRDWDNTVGGYWPRLRESTPVRSTIRAR